jgi:hypothetical protein
MRDNFLLWQAYILPYLRIQRLLGFITSTIPCPSQTLPASEKDNTPVLNLAYDLWYEQDQAILSAILSSLSPKVLSQCLFLKTSKELWNKLHNLFAAQSSASTMQIRMRLATRVKNLTDSLAAVGAPLRDDEIMAYLLTGLPEEYDSLVTSATTRAAPMSLSEVYTNLLSFEMCLISRQGTPSHASGPVLNFASRGGHG